MKFLAIALLCLTSMAASAAAPEDAYLAARDRYIAQLRPKDGAAIDDKTTKAEARARAELEQQLRRIIAPIKGATRDGKINLESLIEGDLGFEQLDALFFTLPDETRVTVTTRALLGAWLKRRRKDRIPAQANAALRSENFYTQAISSGASVARFADVPVAFPGGFATAMLATRRQDIGLATPRELIVALISGERVYLASVPAAPDIAMMPACAAVWKEFENKAQAIYDKYKTGNLKDAGVFDVYIKTQEDGDAALRKCFAARAKDAPFFPGLRKQAQDLVDRLK
jgi:hypothetical protein